MRNLGFTHPPLSEIIFCGTPINLVKLTFLEEISNCEINLTCVKYKKERKITSETKSKFKMYHIQRKTVSILTILHVYSDLDPLVIKKSEIG